MFPLFLIARKDERNGAQMAKAEVAAIEKRCEQIAADMGYELVDVAIEKEPTGKYLRFYLSHGISA